SLQQLGVAEEAIELVILSHLHFDHAGGLLPSFTPATGEEDLRPLCFPNAQYVVSPGAWQRALHPHPRDRASFIPELNSKLNKSGRLLCTDEGKNLPAPFNQHLRFFTSDGHTPHQMHTVVRGQKSTAVFCGD